MNKVKNMMDSTASTQILPEYEELFTLIKEFEPDETAREILARFLAMLSEMKPNEPQTVKSICKMANWESKDEQSRKNVGKIIAKTVNFGLLPLRANGRNTANASMYVLK